MPRSGWARGPQLLSLHVWSLCSATGEAATVKGPRTAMKSGPRSPQLEKTLARRRRPNTAKKKKKKKKKKLCLSIPLIYLALESPSLSFSSRQGGWVLQNISSGILHFCLLLEFSNWEAPAGKPCVEAKWNHSIDLLFTPCQAMDLFRRFSSIATTLTGFWEPSARPFPCSCMLVQGNSSQCCQSLVLHHLLLDF